MALYDTSNDDSTEHLRKEAERDTQAVLEREQHQKEERERQHRDTLLRELREKERVLKQKEVELGALKLEESHLEYVVSEARKNSSNSETRSISRLEALVRDIRAKIQRTKDAETKIGSELHTKERILDDDELRVQAHTKKAGEQRQAIQKIKAKLQRERDEADSLAKQIRELEEQTAISREATAQKISETRRSTAEAREANSREERVLRELNERLEALREQERKLMFEIENHKRDSDEKRMIATAQIVETPADTKDRELAKKQQTLDLLRRDIQNAEKELQRLEGAAQDEIPNTVQEERVLRELTESLARAKGSERTLSKELEEQERALEEAQRTDKAEERTERERAERGQSAEARRAEEKRRSSNLEREIENSKREIEDLKRQGA